ncbi:MAG: hypothetical protein OXN21_10435 [Chloroflexota bacterium]|nr:hypothetical protein [Chloroflexota bacterium]
MNELIRLLQDFLASNASLAECAEWLAGVDWSDPEMTEDEQEAYGLFELMVTEVAEEIRDETEFRTEVQRFLSERTSPALR